MANISEKQIYAALAKIDDPIRGGDLSASGRVQGIVIKDGNIGFAIEITPAEAEQMEAARRTAEQVVRDIKGVLSVSAVLTSHQEDIPQNSPQADKARPAANREIPAIFSRFSKVIAVASGKGGVGKSTIALHLALALAKTNKRVGLLDADIYGPSIPSLLDITETPRLTETKKLIPIEKYGLMTMSIGYIVKAEQAMIWRGPMVQSALLQLLNDVEWPELDILVMDLPPGTGDIQLTIAQRFPVSGAVLVSTPQSLALADVRRSMAMFTRVDIPLLGVVENMAYLTAPDGTKLFPFGEPQAAKLAQEFNTDYLISLPLDPHLQTQPPNIIDEKSEEEKSETGPLFAQLAQELLVRL